VGIFVGWIIQKRWMTATAFVVTVIGAFTLPRLASPFSYAVLLPPVLLVMAIIYEGGSLPGISISSKLRSALALWMGFSVLVLMAGIVFVGSSSSGLIATIAIFSVLLWQAYSRLASSTVANFATGRKFVGVSQATSTRRSELNGLRRIGQAELRSTRIRQGLNPTW
jgi:hypothetical protein